MPPPPLPCAGKAELGRLAKRLREVTPLPLHPFNLALLREVRKGRGAPADEVRWARPGSAI